MFDADRHGHQSDHCGNGRRHHCHGCRRRFQLREIALFDPAWVAVPAMVLGLVLLLVLSRWLLKSPTTKDSDTAVERSYGAEFVIPDASPLAGKTIEIAGFAEPIGFKLVGLIRADGSSIPIELGTTLAEGDVLLISAELDSLDQPLDDARSGAALHHESHGDRSLSPPADRGRDFPTKFGAGPQGLRVSPLPESPFRLSLVAVSRDDEAVAGRIGDLTIQVGDVAVLEVDDSFFYVNRGENSFSLVRRVRGHRIRRWHKAAGASAITAAYDHSGRACGWMSMLNAALLATGAMLLTRCLTIRNAASSIDYSTLGVLGAAIGVAAAVSESGLAAQIATILTNLGGTCWSHSRSSSSAGLSWPT